MYEIIKRFNNTTFLAMKDNVIYVLKKTGLDDIEIYKKLMKVNHKNIVRIYELTVVDNDFFAVCEYVQGETLGGLINKDGPMDYEKVKNIVSDICDGLEQIHSLGLVHRDISPNNIMITADGTAKIIDFGISRIRKAHGVSDTEILGTHGFAAPEQYGFTQTSYKADIYALGVLINYMCTGFLPNEKIVNGTYSEIVIKCTQMDEKQRYNSVNEIRNDINKKLRAYSAIRKIPGFRRNVWWHKLIASIYYFIIILFFIFSFVPGEWTLKESVASAQFVVFGLFAPVLIIMNFNNWLEKIPFIKNKKRIYKVIFSLFCAGFLFIASALIL